MPLSDFPAIRRASQHAERGALRAVDAFREGRSPDEPRVVERMLAGIEHEIAGLSIRGLTWEAGTLSSLRPKAAETKYGADFLGLFDVNLPDYKVTKGFLAQAKLFRSSHDLGPKERGKLQAQCHKMLSRSPDSFVFLLSPTPEIRIVPAISVIAGDNEPWNLYFRGVQHFFEEHFASFIGDGVFTTPNVSALDQIPSLQDRYDVRHVLYVLATSDPGGVRARIDELKETPRRPR